MLAQRYVEADRLRPALKAWKWKWYEFTGGRGWWEWREHEAGWLGKCFKMNNTSSMPFAKKKKVCLWVQEKTHKKQIHRKTPWAWNMLKMHFKLRYNRYKKNPNMWHFFKVCKHFGCMCPFFCIVENNWCCHICQSNQNPKQPMTAGFSMQLMSELCAGGQIRALSIK